ncbi:hypothetical protein MC7420_2420 [Coleofasciculus chthonoplastes PCC 7420]|uniref:Uncharacterized protein n=1 Tax=Coleofasciculus chthonoplastes PCC 7420 TaxID=118168 RepID=B4W261_9CYAN|nr:hypothetical protein MC7420_2420 [Coleofasciculus chthonoplastes PCC 7420]
MVGAGLGTFVSPLMITLNQNPPSCRGGFRDFRFAIDDNIESKYVQL